MKTVRVLIRVLICLSGILTTTSALLSSVTTTSGAATVLAPSLLLGTAVRNHNPDHDPSSTSPSQKSVLSLESWRRYLSDCRRDFVVGYQQRLRADTNFWKKSIVEVFLAVMTQGLAELKSRGGWQPLIKQLDFVLANILTAIAGKYYSMWKVAKTTELRSNTNKPTSNTSESRLLGTNMTVPTNAFQPYLLDGVTRPTLPQRVGSILLPMPDLFRVGCSVGLFGFGTTFLIIQLRKLVLPSYVAQTHTTNVFYASVYTGFFLATISNLRYQVLQGIVEPPVDRLVQERFPLVHAALIFWIRIGNGLLGSLLAIWGMKQLGLQKLK